MFTAFGATNWSLMSDRTAVACAHSPPLRVITIIIISSSSSSIIIIIVVNIICIISITITIITISITIVITISITIIIITVAAGVELIIIVIITTCSQRPAFAQALIVAVWLTISGSRRLNYSAIVLAFVGCVYLLRNIFVVISLSLYIYIYIYICFFVVCLFVCLLVCVCPGACSATAPGGRGRAPTAPPPRRAVVYTALN